MFKALTAQQSRTAEQSAVAGGVSLAALMDSAGEAVACEVMRRVPEGDVVVLCGPGNNGGDGWVAATFLHASGRRVRVLAVRPAEELGGIAGDAARAAVAAGVRCETPEAVPEAESLGEAAVIVDALLGTGAALPLRHPLTAWCEAANGSGSYIVSADLPTGCDADSGACPGAAIEADCTVTFSTVKRGLVLYPGAARAGEVVVADIGLPRESWENAPGPEVWTPGEYARLIRMPAPDVHKNDRGRVLVVAGSGHFPGAAVLAARGAMRAGCGYVTLAVPAPIVPVAQAHLLAAPVVGLPASGSALSWSAASVVRDMASDYDVVVLGPGLTVADGAAATVRRLVSVIEQPLVLDADGLNAFIDHVDVILARQAPIVLTPHPGELGRLLGSSTDEVQADRLSSSARLAGNGRVVLLKGAGTVTSGNGRQVINTSGTPALATAGTGDVLAGMVGALLAQGMDPLDAGALGAYLHGRAGEVAARELTPMSVTAEDLPEYVPLALGEVLEEW